MKDGSDAYILIRFAGADWTIIPRIVGFPVRGVAALRSEGQQLADDLGVEVVQMFTTVCYHRRPGQEPTAWPPLTSASDPDSASSDRDYARRASAQGKEIDSWLAERGLTLPPIEIGSDGLCPRITVVGVPKKSVERVDVVVAREWV